jgi:hypothetical protein
MWFLLWLLVGGGAGHLANRLRKKYGPPKDANQQRKERIMGLLLGTAGGFLTPFFIPVLYLESVKDRKLLEGPSAKDSLPECLQLRERISIEIMNLDKRLRKREALLGGVHALIEADYSWQAAHRAGIKPDTNEMPTPEATARACQEWLELNHQREQLEYGLERTNDRIADINAQYEGQIEAIEIPAECLRPNGRLLRPDRYWDQRPPATPAALPAPEPEPDPDAYLLEQLGCLRNDRLAVHLLVNAQKALEIAPEWRCQNLVALLGGPYQNMRQRLFEKKGRIMTAEWIHGHFMDTRLALAVSDAGTPEEVGDLVRFRLEQAYNLLAQQPPDTDPEG